MNKLFFASLLALSATTTIAVADRTDPVMPHVPADSACVLGVLSPYPLFQIDRKSDLVKDYRAGSLVIARDGSWRSTITVGGKVVEQKLGCLADGDLRTLQAALARATWKTTRADVACTAFATDYTQYAYGGKHVMTSRMCDGQIVDAATQKALAGATAITSKLFPKA